MAFQYSPKIVTDGLVFYLDAANPKSYVSGSTVWNDISRGGNTGTLVNGPVYSGTSAGSIVLDGTNDFIYVPFILDTSTNYTIEVIGKSSTMTTDINNRQTLWCFASGTSQGYQLLDFEIWGDGLTSFNGDNTNFATPLLATLTPIGTTDIKVYTLSKSGTSQSWYVNGVFRISVTQTYTGTSQYFKIGTRGPGTTGTGTQWNGIVYSAKIYNRNLTASEILQNYNATKSRFGIV